MLAVDGMSAATSTQWYLAREGQQFGPISEAELAKFIELGHLQPNDLLWREGFPDWRPALVVFPPRNQRQLKSTSTRLHNANSRTTSATTVSSAEVPTRTPPLIKESKVALLPVNEVFVVGGQPKHTYVSRSSEAVEDAIKKYLADGHKFLSFTGPTTSGKTVMLSHLIGSHAVTVPGGGVQTAEDFLASLRVSLGMHVREQRSTTTGVEGKAALPFMDFLKAALSRQITNKKEFDATDKFSALNALRESAKVLIVDDFHHMPEQTRRAIALALKDPVRLGLRVILVSVPHRGFDAVRAVPELQGRLQHRSLPPWSAPELIQIAEKGFSTLNLDCDTQTAQSLYRQSYGSPLLMQGLCKHLCEVNGVTHAVTGRRKRLELNSHIRFYKAFAASELGPSDLETILSDRPPRAQRASYDLKAGGKCDYYSLTLWALAELLPERKLRSARVFEKAQELINRPGMLQQNQITSALKRMSDAASESRKEIFEWDDTTSTIHVVDPSLAFMIKWGEWAQI